MKLSACFVAPILALSLACEPAGAGHTVDGALGGKKKASKTLKDPKTNIKDASTIKPVKKPAMDAATLLARAKAAGWSAGDIKVLKTTLADAESLTETELNRVRCRLGEVFQARKPVVLTTLREAGATNAELEAAGKAVDGIAAALCSNGLTKDKKKKVSLETQQEALGKIFVQVNERLTAGTTLAGENVTLVAFEDLMREMNERCALGNVSLKGLATMSDAEFDGHLNKLAFGSCSPRSAGSGGIPGLPNLPAGSDADGYAQCVRAAFREGVTSNADCGGIAGGDGDGDGDTPTSENTPTAPERPNPAADEQDRESHTTGGKYLIAGILATTAGVSVTIAGVGIAAVGVATSEIGVGVAVAAIGVGVIAMGVGMVTYGVEQMDEADRNYTDRNRERPSWAWQCPTLSTPVGSFAFANPIAGGTSGAQPNMTVMDTLRACRCENNPLDDFLASGGTGAFGGPSCDLGSRLDCLRERDNDMGPPSPECRMLLRGDNQVSIAARLQECSVINCGEGLVGEDCSCWSGGGGGSGGGSNPCATVQCPDGAQPIPEGMRCTCESNPLDGPTVDCLPGAPGCDDNTIPGVLPGGGPIPTPLPTPIPMPKPIPNSPFKK